MSDKCWLPDWGRSWPVLHSCSFLPTSRNAAFCSPKYHVFLKVWPKISTSVASFSLRRLYCMPRSPLCVTNSLGKAICVGDTPASHRISSKFVLKIATVLLWRQSFFLCPCSCHPHQITSITFSEGALFQGLSSFHIHLHIFFLIIF